MKLRFGILTVSDRSARGERPDLSGPALQQQVISQGWLASQVDVVPDDFSVLQSILTEWTDRGDLDVVLTTGGTGFSPRDITPEATLAIVDRQAPARIVQRTCLVTGWSTGGLRATRSGAQRTARSSACLALRSCFRYQNL